MFFFLIILGESFLNYGVPHRRGREVTGELVTSHRCPKEGNRLPIGQASEFHQPVPILAGANSPQTSVPRFPQSLQTNSGSMSESRISSGQRSPLIWIERLHL